MGPRSTLDWFCSENEHIQNSLPSCGDFVRFDAEDWGNWLDNAMKIGEDAEGVPLAPMVSRGVFRTGRLDGVVPHTLLGPLRMFAEESATPEIIAQIDFVPAADTFTSTPVLPVPVASMSITTAFEFAGASAFLIDRGMPVPCTIADAALVCELLNPQVKGTTPQNAGDRLSADSPARVRKSNRGSHRCR